MQAATQEQRTADILAFAKRLPPGPRPYDQQEFAPMRELVRSLTPYETRNRRTGE